MHYVRSCKESDTKVIHSEVNVGIYLFYRFKGYLDVEITGKIRKQMRVNLFLYMIPMKG